MWRIYEFAINGSWICKRVGSQCRKWWWQLKTARTAYLLYNFCLISFVELCLKVWTWLNAHHFPPTKLHQARSNCVDRSRLYFGRCRQGYSLWWSESPDFGKRPKKPCPKVKYRQVWQPMRLSHWYAVTKLQLWGNHRIPPLILKMLLFLSSVIPYLSRRFSVPKLRFRHDSLFKFLGGVKASSCCCPDPDVFEDTQLVAKVDCTWYLCPPAALLKNIYRLVHDSSEGKSKTRA